MSANNNTSPQHVAIIMDPAVALEYLVTADLAVSTIGLHSGARILV